MTTFTVFNIGSGHNRHEPNNTIGNLWEHARGMGRTHINDGPTNLAGHMEKGVSDAISAIAHARPNLLNLTGHSRGAVMCHMIANDIAAAKKKNQDWATGILQINMCVMDPVNMSRRGDRALSLRPDVSLGRYVSIVMENVNQRGGGIIFPSTSVSADALMRRRMMHLTLPGTHGSGTQCKTSAIGRAARSTIRSYLTSWGTIFNKLPQSAKQICEDYAGIHLENPIIWNQKTGLQKQRLILDSAKTEGGIGAVSANFESRGRVKTIAANFERMAQAGQHQTNFTDTPYFFNQFHFASFGDAFPATFAFMNRGRSQWRNPAVRDGNDTRGQIDAELDEIERAWPNIKLSLQGLGML